MLTRRQPSATGRSATTRNVVDQTISFNITQSSAPTPFSLQMSSLPSHSASRSRPRRPDSMQLPAGRVFCPLLRPLLFLLAISSPAFGLPSASFPVNSQVPPVARADNPFDFVFSPDTFSSTTKSPLRYSLANSPAWLAIDSSQRRLHGTPQAREFMWPTGAENDNSNGVIGVPFDLVATDSEGSTTMKVTLVVSRNPPPTVNRPIAAQLPGLGAHSPPATIMRPAAAPFTLQFAADTFASAGSGSRSLSYYAVMADNTPLPAWAHFDGERLELTGTTPPKHVLVAPPQQFDFQLIASDVVGFSAAAVRFSLVVGARQMDAPQEPVIVNVIPGQPMVFPGPLGVVTIDGHSITPAQVHAVTASPAELPTWVILDHQTGALSGTPPLGATSQTLTMTVEDKYADRISVVVRLQVAAVSVASMFVGSWPSTMSVSAGQPVKLGLGPFLRDTTTTNVMVDTNPNVTWLSYDSAQAAIVGNVPANVDMTQLEVAVKAAPKGVAAAAAEVRTLRISIHGATVTAASLPPLSTLSTKTVIALPSDTKSTPANTPSQSAAPIRKPYRIDGGLLVLIIVLPILFMGLLGLLTCYLLQRRHKYRREKAVGKRDKQAKAKSAGKLAVGIPPSSGPQGESEYAASAANKTAMTNTTYVPPVNNNNNLRSSVNSRPSHSSTGGGPSNSTGINKPVQALPEITEDGDESLPIPAMRTPQKARLAAWSLVGRINGRAGGFPGSRDITPPPTAGQSSCGSHGVSNKPPSLPPLSVPKVRKTRTATGNGSGVLDTFFSNPTTNSLLSDLTINTDQESSIDCSASMRRAPRIQLPPPVHPLSRECSSNAWCSSDMTDREGSIQLTPDTAYRTASAGGNLRPSVASPNWVVVTESHDENDNGTGGDAASTDLKRTSRVKSALRTSVLSTFGANRLAVPLNPSSPSADRRSHLSSTTQLLRLVTPPPTPPQAVLVPTPSTLQPKKGQTPMNTKSPIPELAEATPDKPGITRLETANPEMVQQDPPKPEQPVSLSAAKPRSTLRWPITRWFSSPKPVRPPPLVRPPSNPSFWSRTQMSLLRAMSSTQVTFTNSKNNSQEGGLLWWRHRLDSNNSNLSADKGGNETKNNVGGGGDGGDVGTSNHQNSTPQLRLAFESQHSSTSNVPPVPQSSPPRNSLGIVFQDVIRMGAPSAPRLTTASPGRAQSPYYCSAVSETEDDDNAMGKRLRDISEIMESGALQQQQQQQQQQQLVPVVRFDSTRSVAPPLPSKSPHRPITADELRIIHEVAAQEEARRVALMCRSQENLLLEPHQQHKQWTAPSLISTDDSLGITTLRFNRYMSPTSSSPTPSSTLRQSTYLQDPNQQEANGRVLNASPIERARALSRNSPRTGMTTSHLPEVIVSRLPHTRSSSALRDEASPSRRNSNGNLLARTNEHANNIAPGGGGPFAAVAAGHLNRKLGMSSRRQSGWRWSGTSECPSPVADQNWLFDSWGSRENIRVWPLAPSPGGKLAKQVRQSVVLEEDESQPGEEDDYTAFV